MDEAEIERARRAALARRLTKLARLYAVAAILKPECAGGFRRCAEGYSERAAGLLREVAS